MSCWQVRKTVDTLISILQEKELRKPEKKSERRAKLRKTIRENFNFDEMAKRSLGLHWKSRTPEEQKEFVALYSDLLENSYIRKIERYENEKVVYQDERLDGDYAVVKTQIIDKMGLSIPVDYRTFRKKDKWEIYDIVIEGVSLVNKYRTQFTQIIRSSSYAELVKRLRAKNLQ